MSHEQKIIIVVINVGLDDNIIIIINMYIALFFKVNQRA